MHTQIVRMIILTAAIFATPAFSQETKDAPLPPAAQSAAISRSGGNVALIGKVVARGTITHIDTDRREITVKRANGKEVVVPAGPEVHNFAEISVGDRIVVREDVAVVLSLKKAEGNARLRQRIESHEWNLAKPGDKPGVSGKREIHIMADIAAINKKSGMITLKGVKETRQFRLTDPSLIANVRIGDQVEAVVKESGAIFVKADVGR